GRHDLRQRAGLLRPAPSLRRRQALRVRPGACARRHPRIRQPQGGARRRLRRLLFAQGGRLAAQVGSPRGATVKTRVWVPQGARLRAVTAARMGWPPARVWLCGRSEMKAEGLQRARGALLGQLAGDALGSMVEFQCASFIRALFPAGIREIGPSPVWGTIPGQPTDDSEMALALARTLAARGFDLEAIRAAYVEWLDSGPFDVGRTTRLGLRGQPQPESQANGGLMCASPLGIFGHRLAPKRL